MAEFLVKAVHLDGVVWPVWTMMDSLGQKELGDTEWWRRMAVLQHAAVSTGDVNLLIALNKFRKDRYNVEFEEPEVVSINNLPNQSVEECVKRWFQGLDESKQQEVLTEAMAKLLEATGKDGKELFTKKQHWMAVYIVLRYRLGLNIQQNNFFNYAKKITPEKCPAKLRISSLTMTNFSKTVPNGIFSKLNTEKNPFYAQCNSLWTIIRKLYYSDISTNE